MRRSVGEVARIARVSVRTLHHYDEIGLLSPSGRTPAGYRVYADADLDRLQRVLCYRELGFALDDIAALLDDPGVDPVEHLRRQHTQLTGRIERLLEMAGALEKTMEAHAMGINLDPHEMLAVFGDADPSEHAAEAEQRWGDTEAYRESQQRTSGYTKHDWLRQQAAAEEVEQRFAAALAAGLPPGSEEATAAAEAHREHISRWFYDCSYEIHRGLAEMYVADERFTAHFDRRAPGLARFVHDAVLANADRR